MAESMSQVSADEQLLTAQSGSTSAEPSPRPPIPASRRRDKPTLSCTACRRRKIRCDRLHPCSNCSIRGLGSSCVYFHVNGSSRAQEPPETLQARAANMQDRINKLEGLVLDLMHHSSPSSMPSPMPGTQPSPSQGCLPGPDRPRSDPDSDTVVDSEPNRVVSPSPSDFGSLRDRQKGVNYVTSSHWAAVLDSISDLRNHLAQEEDSVPQPLDLPPSKKQFPRPQLFYSHINNDTVASIVRSLPPRPTVDRLVSLYFNVVDIAPGVVHSGQFLQEYEEFWRAPQSVSIAWIGLLFCIMCLSKQLQQAFPQTQPAPFPTESGYAIKTSQAAETEALVDLYKSQAIKCLLLCHWTKGGAHVLETLILYLLVECFHLKDMQIGIWMLVGNIVQIAMHMGYHRDASHFPSISPFAGEMRRRAWAMILQLDISVSTQLGLPRLVREQHTDTAKPRNLNDLDFDINTPVLPESRPETEVTPTLYVLAKLRLLSVATKVADVATEPKPHSYSDIVILDQEIHGARNALPEILKWNGLASSLNVSSQTMVQRIWLEVITQQLRIVLHKKFLEPSRTHHQFHHSRSTCLEAALKILELQRLVDEETQADGLMYQSRWRVSSAFNNDFLLATSVLCSYLQNYNALQKQKAESPMDDGIEAMDATKIREALKQSQEIWIRHCDDSKEARKAVMALCHVLGDVERGSDAPSHHIRQHAPTQSFSSTKAMSHFPDFSQEFNFSTPFDATIDGLTWQTFSASFNNAAEEWAGVDDIQQMDFPS